MESDGSVSIGPLLAVLAAYFLPSIIAGLRKHPNGAAIGIVNTFLGWTLIGWVVALAWSVTSTDKPAAPPAPARADPAPARSKAEATARAHEVAADFRGKITRQDGDAGPSGKPATAIAPLDVTFDYIDARGNPTERTVTVRSIECDWDGTPITVTGRCHARKSSRTFRVDRMDGVISPDGEVLDPDLFFQEEIEARALPESRGD